MDYRVDDKVFYGGKLCEITRNRDNGMYDLAQIGSSFVYRCIYADEIDALYTRKCVEFICEKQVMPDAERGRCEECLEELKQEINANIQRFKEAV